MSKSIQHRIWPIKIIQRHCLCALWCLSSRNSKWDSLVPENFSCRFSLIELQIRLLCSIGESERRVAHHKEE